MSYITRLEIRACRNVAALDIDLTPEAGGERPFRHLILTGPNGSGKSGVLEAIGFVLNVLTDGESTADHEIGPTVESFGTGAEPIARGPATVYFSTSVRQTYADHRRGAWLAVYKPSVRSTKIHAVSTPTKQEHRRISASREIAASLQQFLVNKKVEQAFAGSDQDEVAAAKLAAFFDQILEQIRGLFDQPGMTWSFNRRSYQFTFKLPGGYEFNLQELADGYASALSMFSELLMRIDACRAALGDERAAPTGVVVIDEIESHLHLALQERILPLLTRFFPTLQFIVATHSPAVIASIDGAEVVDLGGQGVTHSTARAVRQGHSISAR